MSISLLLADDSPTIAKILSLALASEQYQIKSVLTAEEALTELKANPPFFFLCDLSLPAKNGYEFARLIKSDTKLAKIRVVLLASAFEPVDEQMFQACGADGLVKKPFDPSELRNKLRQIHDMPAKQEASRVTGSLSGFMVNTPEPTPVDLSAPAAEELEAMDLSNSAPLSSSAPDEGGLSLPSGGDEATDLSHLLTGNAGADGDADAILAGLLGGGNAPAAAPTVPPSAPPSAPAGLPASAPPKVASRFPSFGSAESSAQRHLPRPALAAHQSLAAELHEYHRAARPHRLRDGAQGPRGAPGRGRLLHHSSGRHRHDRPQPLRRHGSPHASRRPRRLRSGQRPPERQRAGPGRLLRGRDPEQGYASSRPGLARAPRLQSRAPLHRHAPERVPGPGRRGIRVEHRQHRVGRDREPGEGKPERVELEPTRRRPFGTFGSAFAPGAGP